MLTVVFRKVGVDLLEMTINSYTHILHNDEALELAADLRRVVHTPLYPSSSVTRAARRAEGGDA